MAVSRRHPVETSMFNFYAGAQPLFLIKPFIKTPLRAAEHL
jgi:hypothetical protein